VQFAASAASTARVVLRPGAVVGRSKGSRTISGMGYRTRRDKNKTQDCSGCHQCLRVRNSLHTIDMTVGRWPGMGANPETRESLAAYVFPQGRTLTSCPRAHISPSPFSRPPKSAPAGDGLRRTFGRPFPNQICLADVRCIVHRLVRDRLKGLTPAVSNTNGGTDLQPQGTEITGVGDTRSPPRCFH
jgi:hypothetical protein